MAFLRSPACSHIERVLPSDWPHPAQLKKRTSAICSGNASMSVGIRSSGEWVAEASTSHLKEEVEESI